MERKMLIVDDRCLRQQEDLGTEQYNDLLTKKHVTLQDDIDGLDSLEEFDVIAVHRSYAVTNKILDELVSFIKNSDRYLILFSGGTGEQYMDLNGKYISINSQKFYSPKLLEFIDDLNTDENINLYKLLYGIHNWKLPFLFRFRYLNWILPTIDQGTPRYQKMNREIRNMKQMFPEETENVNDSIRKSLMKL